MDGNSDSKENPTDSKELKKEYEIEIMPGDGDCLFNAIATALRRNPAHFGNFKLFVKYDATSPSTIRNLVADTIMILSASANVWKSWLNCIMIPEFRQDFMFAMPLLRLGILAEDIDKCVIKEIPKDIRMHIRHNMLNPRYYWGDHYALQIMSENLGVNLTVIQENNGMDGRLVHFRHTKSTENEATIIVVRYERGERGGEHYNLVREKDSKESMFCGYDNIPKICQYFFQ
jgi:hypothetical protein